MNRRLLAILAVLTLAVAVIWRTQPKDRPSPTRAITVSPVLPVPSPVVRVVGGKVTTHQGRALEGRIVAFIDARNAIDAVVVRGRFSIQTDDSPRRLVFVPGAGDPGVVTWKDVRNPREPEAFDVVVDAQNVEPLHGIVLGSTGLPVRGIEVAVTVSFPPVTPGFTGSPHRIACGDDVWVAEDEVMFRSMTAGEGTFIITGVPGGRTSVFARSPENLARCVTFDLAQNQRSVEIHLP